MLKEFQEKSVTELNDLIKDWKSQLLALRFQQATGQLEKTHQFKMLRKYIARAMFVIAQKQDQAPKVKITKEDSPKTKVIKKTQKKKEVNENDSTK